MKYLKEFMLKDYMNDNTKKIMKLRGRILKCNFKIIKFLLIKKYKKLLFKSQSFLPISEKISNNIIFPHGLTGIFISSDSNIGDGSTLYPQVTIGSNTILDSKTNGSPSIGKNCYIGAGAKIIGNANIGNNCRIGAGTTVTRDIPDNSTVVGASFRIITHSEKLNNEFVSIDKFNR